MAPKAKKKAIQDMKPGDSFILSDNHKTGITLRDDIGDNPAVGTGDLAELPEAQIVCQAMNEAARKHGQGKFFYIPSRKVRSFSKEYGYVRSGPDVVYIPWMWSDFDNAIWDNATPYDRLRLTNAWTCLPGKTIVMGIFVQYRVKPTGKCPSSTFPLFTLTQCPIRR